MMKQDLFDWEAAEEPISKPTPVSSEIQVESKWEWWDPWPEGLTVREQYMRQVGRDRRALEECHEESERQFFLARIVAYCQSIKDMEVTPCAPSRPHDVTAIGTD